MTKIGYIVLLPASPFANPCILSFDPSTFSFDDLIGGSDNDLYTSGDGDVEVHITVTCDANDSTNGQKNRRARTFLHSHEFCHPLPSVVYGDVFITGEDNSLLSYSCALRFKNACL